MLASGRCCKNMITFLKPSHLKTSSNNNIICLNFDWITKYFFLRHSNCVERKGKEILVVITCRCRYYIFLSVYSSVFCRFFFLAVNFVSWSHKDLTASKHKNLTLPAKFVHCQFMRQTSRITIVLWFFCNSFVNNVRTRSISYSKCLLLLSEE